MGARESNLKREFLGSGLITPLQRISGNDFVWAEGERLVKSSISQILGTRPGELPWRPDFGTDLERYRYKSAVDATASALATEIVESVSRFEPRATITTVVASAEDNVIKARISWSITSEASEGNNVLLGPISQEVSF
jgi:phage baseplate assembly protein W